ncbi:MAG TPA: glycosyltransferase family 2 protein [Geobacteraceae bacterium]|nr:glycosyltransferase family 2 protein [Geobacteraceae bacterium]
MKESMSTGNKSKISVTVRTYNEEKNIRDCLESVTWADEIIVVDAQSTDSTVAIAREYTDRIIIRPWAGHIATSQFATDQAANMWVFSIDADERVSPPLRDEILAIDLDATTHDAFDMPRRHYFMGRWINHSGWYPDRNIRLYRKDHCHWGGYAPHDKIQVPGSLASLKNDLHHYIYRDLAHFAATKNSYSTLTAIDHYRNGRRATLLHFTIRPLYTFLHRYLIRLGFLDGLAGFVISAMEAHCVFMKYLKLYELQKTRVPSEKP